MSAAENTALPTPIDEVPIWKALQGLERLAGLAHDEGAQARFGNRGCVITLRLASGPQRPEPAYSFEQLVGVGRVEWSGVKWTDTVSHPTWQHASWDDIADTRRNGALTLKVFAASLTNWSRFEPRIAIWARAVGLRVARCERISESREGVWHSLDLHAPDPEKVGWLRFSTDVEAALAAMIELEGGGPCSVQIEFGPVHQEGELRRWSWWAPQLRSVAVPVALIVAPAAPSPQHAGLRDDAILEIVRTLDRARRTAPRGYVGFKHFRDKLLMPALAPERRRALLDDAVAEGILRTGKAVDPVTGQSVVTVEPDPEHPKVAALVRAALGPLPDLVELRGERLSATIAAMREAER
jgi:hypothetical protein